MSVQKCKAMLDAIAAELNDILQLDAHEMLRVLLVHGKKLSPLKEYEFVKENYVHGCISNAYVVLDIVQDNYVLIRGHSDAMVVKGFMGILSETCSTLTIVELSSDGMNLIGGFVKQVALDIILTPTRANAFGNIVQLIMQKANHYAEV